MDMPRNANVCKDCKQDNSLVPCPHPGTLTRAKGDGNLEQSNYDGEVKPMVQVAFICVHNSCRSQIAEALGKHLAKDVFESYSAGTKLKDTINPDAVRLMREIYGIDMEEAQRPKLLEEIPPVDVVITMGCNVDCPYLPCKFREDWGLDDPTGKSDDEFVVVIREIEDKIRQLRESLL